MLNLKYVHLKGLLMDILIKNVRIITGDSASMDAGTGNIGITRDTISYIGKEDKEADRVIDGKGMIAMPGLSNAHTHSSMVLMRNYVTDKPLEKWLEEGIFPIEVKLNKTHIRNGSLLALVEMIKSGTTSFLDMYYEVETTAEAVLEAGVRANISLGLLTSHDTENNLENSKVEWKNFHNTFNGAGNGLLRTSLEVHSVYLYDEKGLTDSAEFAAETGTMIHCHLNETRSEVENSIAKYGVSPIREFLKCGLLDVPVTAAHTIWIDDEEMDIILEKGVIPVHCASSNMFLGSGFAPVPEMLNKGIPVALGTDGAASNNNLDMIKEMSLSALIPKGTNLDPTVVNSTETVAMATANGAKAIGFKDMGIIKEGFKADLILIDMDKPHNTPLINPLNALVYSTKGSDVDTVIVNGQILMENRELKTLDEERIKYNARQSAIELI